MEQKNVSYESSWSDVTDSSSLGASVTNDKPANAGEVIQQQLENTANNENDTEGSDKLEALYKRPSDAESIRSVSIKFRCRSTSQSKDSSRHSDITACPAKSSYNCSHKTDNLQQDSSPTKSFPIAPMAKYLPMPTFATNPSAPPMPPKPKSPISLAVQRISKLSKETKCVNIDNENINHLKYSYENQIRLLQNRINDLSISNCQLKDRLADTNAQYSLQSAEQVNQMNAMAGDVIRVKQYLVMQHKEVIKVFLFKMSQLSAQIETVQKSNDHSREAVQNLTTQMHSVIKGTGERLQQFGQQTMSNLQNARTVTKNYGKLGKKCQTLYTTQQNKYKEIITKYDESLARKNNEIALLTKEINQIIAAKNKAYYNAAANIDGKLDVLHTCLSEVDIRRRKRFKQYERKIALLEKRLQLKQRNVRARLEFERTKVTIDLRANHRIDIKRAVSALEEKYKVILGEYRAQSEKKYNAYEVQIAELKKETAEISKNSNSSP